MQKSLVNSIAQIYRKLIKKTTKLPKVEEQIELLEEIKAKLDQNFKKGDEVVHSKIRYQNLYSLNQAQKTMQL